MLTPTIADGPGQNEAVCLPPRATAPRSTDILFSRFSSQDRAEYARGATGYVIFFLSVHIVSIYSCIKLFISSPSFPLSLSSLLLSLYLVSYVYFSFYSIVNLIKCTCNPLLFVCLFFFLSFYIYISICFCPFLFIFSFSFFNCSFLSCPFLLQLYHAESLIVRYSCLVALCMLSD